MAKVGPCFMEGWTCQETHFPCYRDCCVRGTQFCNHYGILNLRRCQDCSTREQQCGNYTMPLECDLFCSQRNQTGTPEAATGVPVYLVGIIVIGLLGVIAILAAILYKHIKAKQQLQENASKTDPTDSDQRSLLESVTSNTSCEKEVQTEDTASPEDETAMTDSAECSSRKHSSTECRDPRFSKISPTADASNDKIVVHTGHNLFKGSKMYKHEP